MASPTPMNNPAAAMPQAIAFNPPLPILRAETISISARALGAVTNKSATTKVWDIDSLFMLFFVANYLNTAQF
jgi:hypothetical protein